MTTARAPWALLLLCLLVATAAALADGVQGRERLPQGSKGIAARLPHIAELGADAIWISPFFKSPMADFVSSSPFPPTTTHG